MEQNIKIIAIMIGIFLLAIGFLMFIAGVRGMDNIAACSNSFFCGVGATINSVSLRSRYVVDGLVAVFGVIVFLVGVVFTGFGAIALALPKTFGGQPTVKPANPTLRYCRHCGAPVLADSTFCSSCGKPLA